MDYLILRDHLRRNDADRDLYEQTKRGLLEQDWPDTNTYADAKTDIIDQIRARAHAAQA